MFINISINLWGKIDIEGKHGDMNEEANLYYFKSFWHTWVMCTIVIKAY